MTFAVDHVTCGACAAKIERALAAAPGLTSARVNLTDKRLLVNWSDGAFDPASIPGRLQDLGYDGRPFRAATEDAARGESIMPMVRYLAVAFFGAMNIMLLSVSVWSGNVSDISPETRDLFHWVSALIALPVAAYAGQPFYRSAWRVLRNGHVNMDVPITLGVVLALALSLYETAHSATHAYFDSAVMLLFFLLAGRTLDAMMRNRAQTLTANLLALRGQNARKIGPHGALIETPVAALTAGDRILVAQGDRIGADGVVENGAGEIDQSQITGETRPLGVAKGAAVYAGSLNLGAALTVRVERGGERDFIEEIEQLRARALAVKDKRILFADRAAQLYAPFVHSAAALTFIGWFAATGSLHMAAVTAIAVLIITCPCALGLAIPAVHVAASAALMRNGLLLQEGDALERIAECDTVVFDKTGTLTRPAMELVADDFVPPHVLAKAQRLALASRHPVAQALVRGGRDAAPATDAEETPGLGVRALIDGSEARLGSPAFTGLEAEAAAALANAPGATALGFSHNGDTAVFLIAQHLREDAAKTISGLKALGLQVLIYSGDNSAAVARTASDLGVTDWTAGMTPAGKIAALEKLSAAGRKVMMIGDGVNDAPALAQAHASLAPAGASQITQASADALFLGERLEPVLQAVGKARQARALMSQNLWFAAIYNVLAIPLAVAGLVTPLIAAAAMSISSIAVSLNAARAVAGSHPKRVSADHSGNASKRNRLQQRSALQGHGS
ncbi:MAG: heavy metal translocating P-type ATPase [Beijerinckiaceae bacterium]